MLCLKQGSQTVDGFFAELDPVGLSAISPKELLVGVAV
jgi:hypothetical protein